MSDYSQQNYGQYQHFAQPQVQYPQQYQQPQVQYQPMQSDTTVSTGQWVLTFIIMCIPLVNLIMLFVWAFGSGTKPSKANWAKANLILILIGLICSIAIGIIIAVTGFSLRTNPEWIAYVNNLTNTINNL